MKDKPYTYAIHATDPDGQSLHYALGSSTTATGNITVNPTNGFLTWTPGTVGTYRIQINVIDELGLGVAQVFDVEVLATAPNDPPRITSAPSFSAEAGVEYVYDVNAVDPEGLTPTYQLLTPATLPSGMTFNTETGVLTWISSSEDVGDLVPFVFQASDGTLTARQSFTVRVQPANTAPEIEAIADRSITAGATLRLDVDAVDGEGDPLTITQDQASRDRGL